MSNIKNILAENDDLVKNNGALYLDNLKMRIESAIYVDAIQKAILSIESGVDLSIIAEDLKSSITPQNQKQIKKDVSAA